MAKENVTGREFRRVQDILRRLTEIWNDLTFEDVRSVFRERQIRLNWVMENGGEYDFGYNKKNENLLNKHSQGILSARLLDTLYNIYCVCQSLFQIFSSTSRKTEKTT
jgi:hypothetical protein